MQESQVRRTDPVSTLLMLSILPSTNVTATVILGTLATACFVDTCQSLTTGWKSHKCFQLMDQWWNVMISLEEKGTDSCQYLCIFTSPPKVLGHSFFFVQVQVNINSPLYPLYCQL